MVLLELLLCALFISSSSSVPPSSLVASSAPPPPPSPLGKGSSTITSIDVLIAFKRAIRVDPSHTLASWANSSTNTSSGADFCTWTGILCRPNTNQIKGILLPGRRLQGSITPMLALLPHLSFLDLSSNSLSGSIPPQLAQCLSLSQLILNNNSLSGTLPPSFANLTRLQVLSLQDNALRGSILPVARLPRLRHLNMSANSLNGTLPAELGHCSSLQLLDLTQNSLAGSLPATLGNLTSLKYLAMPHNKLQGVVPSSLGNCSSLEHLNLYDNGISGSIPVTLGLGCRHLLFLSLGVNNLSGAVPLEIGHLSRLQYIEFGGNHFVGKILNVLTNCSDLSILSMWKNSFTESVSPDLGSALPKLNVLVLLGNTFSGSIPASLGNSSSLTTLILGFNQFSGTIPKALFQARKMGYLDLQYNDLSGSIPPEIGNQTLMISRLLVNNNQLTGSLPPELGNLASLQGVNLEFNRFSGNIPYQLANCTPLIVLAAYRNLLQGSIPSSFGRLPRLEHLILDNNMLTGHIPASLSNCSRLTNISLNNNLLDGKILAAPLPSMLYIDLAQNSLSGPIPPELGVMIQLQILDLSLNNLSGVVPAALEGCVDLYSLNFSGNNLEGTIPPSLGTSLRSLIALNLSHNSISGEIPQQLGNLTSLQKLDISFNALSGPIPVSLADIPGLLFANLSYNKLEGPVPDRGSFRNLTAASFLENPGLCGQILHKPCPDQSSRHDLPKRAKIGFGVAASILLLIIVIGCFFLAKSGRWDPSIIRWDLDNFSPFLKLRLEDIQEATNDFSQDNILGSGGTGVVYKGITRDGKMLAFKTLILPTSIGSFAAELRSVGTIRHRNLVRILGYYSDLDNNILILEYMPNGSLDDHLHPAKVDGDSDEAAGECQLPWDIRLRVAMGVAQGLAYLHYDCPEPIIHCDLKPRNILLDAGMEARISDFGLARVMMKTTSFTQNMRGSIGYVAPEYASSGHISRKCDVYSYGIVLMEMVSGRRPTDDVFGEGRTLVGWVRSMFDEGDLVGIMDQRLREDDAHHHGDIKLLLNVALLCTKDDPKERPTMRQVMEMLRQDDLTIKRPSLEELAIDTATIATRQGTNANMSWSM